jgi:hypothetical protein
MTDLRLPCKEGDSDDWFIDRHGKQYADDELVSPDEIAAHLAERDPDGELSAEDRDRLVDGLESAARSRALQRRRQARQACHTDCLIRTQCLGLAIEDEMQHGTWGGYYEEEIRQIRLEITRRRNRARRAT